MKFADLTKKSNTGVPLGDSDCESDDGDCPPDSVFGSGGADKADDVVDTSSPLWRSLELSLQLATAPHSKIQETLNLPKDTPMMSIAEHETILEGVGAEDLKKQTATAPAVMSWLQEENKKPANRCSTPPLKSQGSIPASPGGSLSNALQFVSTTTTTTTTANTTTPTTTSPTAAQMRRDPYSVVIQPPSSAQRVQFADQQPAAVSPTSETGGAPASPTRLQRTSSPQEDGGQRAKMVVQQTPPCPHNRWERISKKKHSISLRCRACQACWKTKLEFFTKCADFYAGECKLGDACPHPHIYSKAAEKHQQRREAEMGQVREDGTAADGERGGGEDENSSAALSETSHQRMAPQHAAPQADSPPDLDIASSSCNPAMAFPTASMPMCMNPVNPYLQYPQPMMGLPMFVPPNYVQHAYMSR